MVVSLKIASQCVKFQLLEPMGGVRARPFSQASAGCGLTVWMVSATVALAATVVTASNRVESRLRMWFLPLYQLEAAHGAGEEEAVLQGSGGVAERTVDAPLRAHPVAKERVHTGLLGVDHRSGAVVHGPADVPAA